MQIATSEYLKTLGSKLAPDIDIMWTGDKVIPKDITVASLEEITTVLKRPPVIWDNEHANDYDQKRVYLGMRCATTQIIETSESTQTVAKYVVCLES